MSTFVAWVLGVALVGAVVYAVTRPRKKGGSIVSGWRFPWQNRDRPER